MPEDTIPLKRFFEAVEERLSACSADELRSILRAMAQVVTPKERQGFLEALVPSKEARDVIQSALRQDDLLSEIDDLVAEIREEMETAEDAYDRYSDHWDDEDSLGPYEQFIGPLTELFDRTAGVFDCGNWSLARDAYRKLFDGLAMEDDYGRGVRADDLRDADIPGARGRYLRALYETEAPANRPERLFDAMQDFGDLLGGGTVMLEDLIRVSEQPLPDREPFLRGWIAFLRKQEGTSTDRWLREAIRLLEGTKGLAAFARKEGKAHPRAYLDWLTALQSEGETAQVVAAARERSGRYRPIGRSARPLPTTSVRRPERSAIPRPCRRVGGRHSPPSRASTACSTSGRQLLNPSAGPGCARPSATWINPSSAKPGDRTWSLTLQETTTWRTRPGSIGPCSRMPGCFAAIGRPPGPWRPMPTSWDGVRRTTPKVWSSRPAWCSSRARRPLFPPTWPAYGIGLWRAVRFCPLMRRDPRIRSV